MTQTLNSIFFKIKRMATDISFLGPVFYIAVFIGLIWNLAWSTLIRAAILRFFIRKSDLPKKFFMALKAVFFPSLITTLLAFPIVFFGPYKILGILVSALYFVLLYFSIKRVYKTEPEVARAITYKFLVLALIVTVVIAGVYTLIGVYNNPIIPYSHVTKCNVDCEFVHRFVDSSLNVKAYNAPAWKLDKKIDYFIGEKTLLVNDMESLKRSYNVIDSIDATGCTVMDFTLENEETDQVICEPHSKDFFTNLMKYLTG